MSPILFSIGKFNVYAFGFFLAVSFVFSTFVIFKYAKEEFKEEEYLDAYLYTALAGLISARFTYIVLHFGEFGFNILRYIVVRETPGLSLIGGLLGAFLFLLWYAKVKKYDFRHLLDLFAVTGSVALVFVKIGEQLGGAGFGNETNFFLGIKIIGLPNRHHPVELYEAFIYFILSIILILLYNRAQNKELPENFVAYMFILIVSLTIFALEFLKVHAVYLYGLSLKQIVALLVFILAAVVVAKPAILRLYAFAKNYRKKKI
jgi:phosphatidylglycerol:prolipoprotein diacylglycerol transferase